MDTCTHPNLTALGTDRWTGYLHCPTCGWESTPCDHVWVPAGIDPADPRVCARCNAKQPSTL